MRPHNTDSPCVQVGQCTPSIMCAGRGFRQAAAGVVNIYAIDMHAGAMGLCTGARPQGVWYKGATKLYVKL